MANQIRAVKASLPLVTIDTGTLTRERNPIQNFNGGTVNSFYPSSVVVEINLITEGETIIVGEFSYTENSAVSDMTAFLNYLDSPLVRDWCLKNDISITLKSDVLDISDILNDTSWEYRAMVEFDVAFTQTVSGGMGIRDGTGKWKQTSSGGGSSKLANAKTGYFEKVKIEYDKEEEFQ